MSLTPTLILAALFAAATGLCGWLGARPPRPMAGPRLVPWRFLMLLGFVGLLLALAHLIALLRGG